MTWSRLAESPDTYRRSLAGMPGSSRNSKTGLDTISRDYIYRKPLYNFDSISATRGGTVNYEEEKEHYAAE